MERRGFLGGLAAFGGAVAAGAAAVRGKVKRKLRFYPENQFWDGKALEPEEFADLLKHLPAHFG